MKKTIRKYFWLILCAVLLVVCAVVLVQKKGDPNAGMLPRDLDHEFDHGSGVVVDDATDFQKDSLYKLAKVWGYVKYRHLSVIAGQINWDAELFRVMPKVLQAADEDAVNAVLLNWLNQFPFEQATAEAAQYYQIVQEAYPDTENDMSWISDRAFLGEGLCAYLEKLSHTHAGDWTYAYARWDGSSESSGGMDFSNETNWSNAFSADDDGMRLLGAFRFWNAYEYFSPNVDITRMDWDQALQNAIDDMLAAEDQLSYERALGRLTAQTGDNHVMLETNGGHLLRFYGDYFLPIRFLSIDGEVVVQAVRQDCTALRPGDVLLAVDGMTMADRIAELSDYFPVPEPDKFVNALFYPLVSAADETSQITLRRGGQEMTVEVTNRKTYYAGTAYPESGLIEDGRIGYIAPATLKEGDLEPLMESFAGTDGLVVDLRQYPAYPFTLDLSEYLIPEPTLYAILELPNVAEPGRFWQLEQYGGAGYQTLMGGSDAPKEVPQYTGKVVLLINETSQSQSEFSTMCLRQTPGAVVVGGPSVGADGNAIYIHLPGGCYTRFTTLGVLTPEREETQRVGVQPDVLCYPTVEGVAAGRDELLEKAVEIIRAG